ncbi:MAG: aminomuconate-semialdehyde/2-hydroxymuconate-6-semialdehyde dehydrogenase [Woeseiaceae bacterium]|jgi:aminomuconate-semialdehyde/2-hydroxymuconate-6-semialdehyde dehydrogenase
MTSKIYKNYIAGEFISSDRFFDDINPVDGSLVARVAEADKLMVEKAVVAAKMALKGEWGKLPLVERCKLLRRIADGIEARFDDFVDAEIADTGKPQSHARAIDIPRGAENFRFFSDLARTVSTECFEMDTPDGSGALNYAVRKPMGVIAVIAPWNLPLLLLTWKLAPALAMGNCVIAKPSEETPGTASLLAEVIHEVGLPSGVFNLLHGFGPDSTGEYLTKHVDIDAITFTGESATGSEIMKVAANDVKPVSFELGGKNAAIVFDDADFDAAIEGTVRSVFSNCGQVCLCSERVYVHESIYEKFVSELKIRAEALIENWPEGQSAELGPLISQEHRIKVLACFARALEEGGNLVTGGGVPEFTDSRKKGSWIQPTIFTGLSEEADMVKQEVFGPVCHISSFASEKELVEKVNNSKYGLAAAVWTKDIKRAHRVSRQLEVGVVWVNTWFLRDLRTPFGGIKLSGVGREGGLHSLEFYSELTNICIKL